MAIFKLLKTYVYKTSIKAKLMILTFALIIFPLSVTSIIMFKNMTDMYKESVYKLSDMSLEYISHVIESKLLTALNTANLIAIDDSVQEILSKNIDDYKMEEQLTDMKNLSNYLQSYTADAIVERVRLGVRDGLIYSNFSEYFVNLDKLKEYAWFDMMRNNKYINSCYWIPSSAHGVENLPNARNVISCVKFIHSIKNFDSIIGLVFVDIPIKELNLALTRGGLTKDAVTLAIDNNNIVIASTDNISSLGEVNNLIDRILESDKETIKISGIEYQVHFKEIDAFNWKIVSLMPIEIIQRERNKNVLFTIILVVTLAGMTLLMGNFLYKSTLRRIKQIVVSMKEVQNGNLNTILLGESEDEIGQIERNYNFMIRRIRELIDETRILAERNRDAEYKYHQAQINPHFLYNTINTISWMAMDYGASKVCHMLKLLSDFYKLNLHSYKDDILLSDQIKHVELYVEIQNMKYDNSVRLEVNIPRELYSCRTPNMLLQPLVENSILHGIMAREDKQGTINICAEKNGNDLVISIIDDGIGMDEDTLLKINSCQDIGEKYGIYNINERIKLKYGAEYGLVFTSIKSKGTRVDVRIPYVV
ncbi:MAG TPA: histidine kinase [Clostridiaceae bacterium]|nr:histidine kinase [Clostridiaceae bacterium]